MQAKVAVIYYSATGTTYLLAKAIEEGARSGGAEVRLRKVRELAQEDAIKSNEGLVAHLRETQGVTEASLDDLTWADALIFVEGTTQMLAGRPAAAGASVSR